jgi:hypothetical protein
VLPVRAAASTSSGSAHSQRVGVTAEAVVQDRGDPVRVSHRGSLSSGFGCGDAGLSQRDDLGLVAAQCAEEHRCVGRDAAPGHLGDRVRFRDQGGGRLEVTPPRVVHGERDQIDR